MAALDKPFGQPDDLALVALQTGSRASVAFITKCLTSFWCNFMSFKQLQDFCAITSTRQLVGWTLEDRLRFNSGRPDRNLFDEEKMISGADFCATARIIVTDAHGLHTQT